MNTRRCDVCGKQTDNFNQNWWAKCPTCEWPEVAREGRRNARVAFYSLAMLGHAVTVGVLTVALADSGYVCGVLTKEDVARMPDGLAGRVVSDILRAALGDS